MDKKSILSILIVVILCGLAAYQYFTKAHNNMLDEKTDIKTTSLALVSEFTAVPNSETKYLNKILEISGVITSLDKNSLTIDDMILCSFEEPINPSIKNYSNMVVKGRFTGYDDSIKQIKINQCLVIE